MNIIKLYNECEGEFLNSIYSEYSKAYTKLEEYISKELQAIYDNCKIDNDKDFDVNYDNLSNYIDGVIKRYIRYSKKIFGNININYYLKCDIIKPCENFINSEQEASMLNKRKAVTFIKIKNQIGYLIKDLKEYFTYELEQFVIYIDNDLKQMKFDELMSTYNDFTGVKEIDDDKQKDKLKKIYSCKDMQRLAFNNGYSYKWSNGSHDIYEHLDTHKIVVIPSHKLGIGLSFKIQKQLISNAV